jgi:hypothetical protein
MWKTDERLADGEGEDVEELRQLPIRHESLVDVCRLSIVAASAAGDPRRGNGFPPACPITWNIVLPRYPVR